MTDHRSCKLRLQEYVPTLPIFVQFNFEWNLGLFEPSKFACLCAWLGLRAIELFKACAMFLFSSVTW